MTYVISRCIAKQYFYKTRTTYNLEWKRVQHNNFHYMHQRTRFSWSYKDHKPHRNTRASYPSWQRSLISCPIL